MGSWGSEFIWLLKEPIRGRIRIIAPKEPVLIRRILKPKSDTPIRIRARGMKVEITKVVLRKSRITRFEGRNLPIPKRGIYSTQGVVELHHADRAGDHLDLRFETPEGVIAFAIPKARLPKLGEKFLAVQADARHGHRELKNPRVIPVGYGAGTTETLVEGRFLIVVEKDHMKVILPTHEGLNLIQTPKGWLVTRMRDLKGGDPVPVYHRPWKSKDISGDLEALQELIRDDEIVLSWKEYGGNYLLRINGDVSLLSRKESVRGGGIDKSWQIPALKLSPEFAKWASQHPDTEIVVEAYCKGSGGMSSPLGMLTRIMNSNLPDSYQAQESVQVRLAGLRILRLDGEDWSQKGWEDSTRKLEQIHLQCPLIGVPPWSGTERGKRSLVDRVQKQGGEGVVGFHRTDPNPVGIKFKFYRQVDKEFVGLARVGEDVKGSKDRIGKALYRSKGQVFPTQGLTDEFVGDFLIRTGKDPMTTGEFQSAVWANPEQFGFRRDGDWLYYLHNADLTLRSLAVGTDELENPSGAVGVPQPLRFRPHEEYE